MSETKRLPTGLRQPAVTALSHQGAKTQEQSMGKFVGLMGAMTNGQVPSITA